MADVHDVAAYILEQKGEMTAMKLQKLVYYSQAYHLVWDGEPLFREPIQAWMNGPVVPELYRRHRGEYEVSEWEGDPSALTEDEKETINSVLSFYGDFTAQELSDLTHAEKPWREARSNVSPTERSNQIISCESMREFYEKYTDDSLS